MSPLVWIAIGVLTLAVIAFLFIALAVTAATGDRQTVINPDGSN